MDPSRSSFAKLNGTSNYQVWAIKMKSYLIAQDLWDIVDADPSKSIKSDAMSKNSKAVSLIILSCEDHIIRLIDPDDFAAAAWKKLKQQYGQAGFSARHLAFQTLVSTNLSSCSNIDQFIDQFRSCVNTLSQMTTQVLPQWLLLSILINNVSSQFEAWTQSIMQQVRTKTISETSTNYLDEVIASLIDEARRLNQNTDNQLNSNVNAAMMTQKAPKTKPICKHCGKIHKSDNCWIMFPEKRPSARFSSANNGAQNGSDVAYSSNNIAFLSQAESKSTNSWIIDSGASQHMCNNRSLFSRFENFATTITIANNTTMNAVGRGDVKIVTKNEKYFTLTNVLFVPQLASNLISVTSATKNHHIRFNFTNGQCQIMYGDQTLATARLQESLLVLESAGTFAYSTKSVDDITWHKRLGHINQEYMTKKPIQSIIGSIEKFSCDTCHKNKSTRNISRTPMTKSKRPLEKIHSDLAGPITPTSLGGNKYVITFTDDYSRFSWVLPCDSKSKFLPIFKVFKRTVETELGQKIAFLHCDNGGEYISNDLRQFANQEGMQIQYTVPHSPEQNGVAERLNRTLFNMTRCFLNDSPYLIKPLWADLTRTACYIKNRLPTSSNKGFLSPFEVLYHHQPELTHLRIIGSRCYSHNTGKILGKLDERSTECFLVGYESNNIFRVYDPLTNKVFRSRDVVICEKAQGNIKSPKEAVSNDNFVYTDINPEITDQVAYQNTPPSTAAGTNDTYPSTLQRPLSVPGQFRSPRILKTPDTSIDELADPQYDNQPDHARSFVAKCLYAADLGSVYIPDTVEQAMTCSDSLKWGESMRDEMKSLTENNTWKLVPTPQNGSKIIQGRWVFRTKSDENGKIVKYKSRWVVKGFQQEEGSSFTDTFACVVKPVSYKILFSIAATQNLEIEQMDVKTAFLNSPIDEEVYVEQPHGFEVSSPSEENLLAREIMHPNQENNALQHTFPRREKSKIALVCKLEKALYGLKQAPRAWYKTLAAFMHESGLSPLKSDYAVFVNHNRTLLVAVYVDDILIFGKDKIQINRLKNLLHRRFQMTDLGQASMYLGMQITRDRNRNTIFLNQRKYIEIILDRFKMTDCNPVSTPMETGLKLCKRADTATPDEMKQYQRLIGSLEYAAGATRPDITFAVHTLAQYASNPDNSHFTAAKRILRYLKGSINFSLVFVGNKEKEFTVFGYTDADWGGYTSDGKSISGYCFYIGNSLISHMSKKQATVALSTAESETHAAIQATKEAIWLRDILGELHLDQRGPTTIYCDNQAAIALSRNPEYHSRSKHVNRKYHFLRENVESGTIELKFVGSTEMAADGLTKPLSKVKHNQFCEFLQGKF